MIDHLGRQIGYLRLSVTDRCNCRCTYCMPEQGVRSIGHENVMTFEEMAAVVEAAASLGVHKVRLTGGEPLVRAGVMDLVRMVAGTPGVDEVCMTTNGCLLAPMAEELKAAGLDRVNVSLDTLDPGRYRAITRCGRLEDALAGLDAAERVGLGPVRINAVLMGGVNDEDVRPLAELARDRDLSVRFIELMPIGEAAEWPRERFVPAERVLEEVPELQPTEGAPGVAELFSAPGWVGTVGLIRPVSHRFCSQCDRIRVTADGMLKPCLHSSREIPLRGLVGNQLVEAIRQGVAAKPERHHLEERASESLRGMNAIGG
ncbi:GTP 3',8-cyclase MoaA [Olsenella sp. YH-ols2217]|uniref:GTP 3',8-cyclase n=1 Tax=Kribbibacterium absianum TaxID=3044210 RepID=A0ABT6ZHW4_9ACTN|nr:MULTISPECIES: GTP 3',8-cyclase MoaA [unclassified Olsenella]MDJ1121151.1 GTP 3',8-cyclase MoaA [Olsenella sp. YH-ols2216]MDJ1128642.1 GTP 3',8-cyclase MoaA [Olsenella sp. YH-ols2217]